ncbi:MAG: gas vesicle protein [Geobacter sp.]|nr:gas vesicle protein [Geobacter sp.]
MKNVEQLEKTEVAKMAMSIGDIIRKARSELGDLTGLELSSTVRTLKDDKGWRVSVEMVEQHVVPSNMDILATYEAILDYNGNFLEFSRRGVRRRAETRVEEE